MSVRGNAFERKRKGFISGKQTLKQKHITFQTKRHKNYIHEFIRSYEPISVDHLLAVLRSYQVCH